MDVRLSGVSVIFGSVVPYDNGRARVCLCARARARGV